MGNDLVDDHKAVTKVSLAQDSHAFLVQLSDRFGPASSQVYVLSLPLICRRSPLQKGKFATAASIIMSANDLPVVLVQYLASTVPLLNQMTPSTPCLVPCLVSITLGMIVSLLITSQELARPHIFLSSFADPTASHLPLQADLSREHLQMTYVVLMTPSDNLHSQMSPSIRLHGATRHRSYQ